MRPFITSILTLLILASAPRPSFADNRDYLTMAGFVAETDGTPVEGNLSVTFSIYSQSSGGSALWTESQTVIFENGVYSATLGDGTDFPEDLFENDNLYVGIKISTNSEMSPRLAMTSLPWALQANLADTALALADGAVTSSSLATGAVTTDDLSDGTIVNADISLSSSIAWSKISKTGAVASDIGAASTAHTHALSDLTSITDALVSDTLTASIFAGSGSTSDAVDLATAEVFGTFPLANLADVADSTHILFAGGAGGDPNFRAIVDADIPDTITAGSASTGAAFLDNGANCQGTGIFAIGVDATGVAECDNQEMPHLIYTRRFGMVTVNGMGDTSVAVIGTSPMTLDDANDTGVATFGANRSYIQLTSSASADAIAGFYSTAYTATRPNYRPKLTGRILTSSSVSDQRVWVGMPESSLVALAPSTTAAATTIDYIAVAYQSGVAGGNWLCCSGDGTNHSCADSGLAVQANTEYTLTVDWTSAGTLVCTVNGTTVTQTSNLSGNTVDLGLYAALSSVAGTAGTFDFNRLVLEQN